MADTAAAAAGTDPFLVLHAHHAAQLRASGLTAEIVGERGYRTVTVQAELRRLGFGAAQALVPTLLVPIRDVRGEICLYQSRPDTPRVVRGKALKYETPRGATMRLDVPARAAARLRDPRVPLWITEGAKKADAGVLAGLCCIALLGVWNFRGTNDAGGKTVLADFESIALNDRAVYVVFDSDVTTKPAVRGALDRLSAFLRSRGAVVRIVQLPAGPDGSKVGLDDYLVTGGTRSDLERLASADLPAVAREFPSAGPYEIRDGGMFLIKETRDGAVAVRLTNFAARIVEEIVRDDGSERSVQFHIELRLKERTRSAVVAAAEFSSMTWVAELFGAGAVLSAGPGVRDHARAAIQALSGDVPQRTVYTHTGWRETETGWAYLHRGGAIAASGALDGVSVDLPPALSRVRLPAPPTGDELRRAVAASLSLVDVAEGGVGAVLFATAYRAPLGAADFSIHLAGPTGVFKTELAALVAQHFGAEQTARYCAASWSGTANANEALAFHCKDAPLVVDDFAPSGAAGDVQRIHREADRLLRAQGNGSGRGRLTADGTLRAVKPPRGLIVSTGEDVPHGQSLRARLLVAEVGPRTVAPERLSAAQSFGADGTFAAAMSAYIRWLATDLEAVQARHAARSRAIRDEIAARSAHRRTPSVVGDLIAAIESFLVFARDADAIDVARADAVLRAARAALIALAESQASLQVAAEPAARFIALLGSVISSGRGHLCAPDGAPPGRAATYGWRCRTSAAEPDWEPRGGCVGWLSGDDLYLDPASAYAAAQRLGQDTGEGLAVSPQTLHKRLNERGHLVTTDSTSGTLTVRRTLAGASRRVLHLGLRDVFPRGGDEQHPSRAPRLRHGPENAEPLRSCASEAP